jgi:hypothetical protein
MQQHDPMVLPFRPPFVPGEPNYGFCNYRVVPQGDQPSPHVRELHDERLARGHSAEQSGITATTRVLIGAELTDVLLVQHESLRTRPLTASTS